MAEVNLAEIKSGGGVGDRQTAKLNSPLAIRYTAYDTMISERQVILKAALHFRLAV